MAKKGYTVQRPLVDNEILAQVIKDVEATINRKIIEKGKGIYAGSHETLGIVAEEYHELIDAVRSNNKDEVISELFDVAVGCLFGIASIRQHRQNK